MGEIRIDQSHCNYHLVEFLKAAGWTVVFTDSGRVSRGGPGSQGACLNVFESSGLPIPDIVAHRGTSLMVIEIDGQTQKAIPSLRRYSARSNEIVASLGYALDRQPFEALRLAYCPTGLITEAKIRRVSAALAESCSELFVFDRPGHPRSVSLPL